MNYRHAFHAGNHTEVFKHMALMLVIESLLQKPTAFAVLDTHAGLGAYDLASSEALRTGEKAGGIERAFATPLSSAPLYWDVVNALNGTELAVYPGSPELVRSVLRQDDRLIACELHPEDGARLKQRYKGDRRVSVHQRDGYEAIGALLPPPQKRGLVFIDPPYERTDETRAIANALRTGFRKWPSGIYFVWYPIKDDRFGQEIAAAALSAGFAEILQAEFCPHPRDGTSLAGSGVILCNPPWTIDEKLRLLCQELAPILGGDKGSWGVEWVRR